MFTFGSLFAGIGGLDLGLERAGMTCKFQVEIDPYCRAVLAKHWPDVPRWDDATTFPPGREGWEVDLICGGFPCQPVSYAGRRRGTADARWLWPEFSRILGLLQPRWVLVENVPGLRSVNSGAAFTQVLQDLARHGYDAEWASVPAAAVGAPHLRYRVFVVAYPNSTRWPEPQRGAGPAQSSRGCVFTANLVEQGISGWLPEPEVARVVDGFSPGVAECGNAVVPQVAEWVGRQILKAEEA